MGHAFRNILQLKSWCENFGITRMTQAFLNHLNYVNKQSEWLIQLGNKFG